MDAEDGLYIWQAPDWPQWRYDLPALADAVARVSHAQGLLLGRLADAGTAQRDQASLAALTDDVVKTSEIEGELLDAGSVRSSVARRLGVDIDDGNGRIARAVGDLFLAALQQALDSAQAALDGVLFKERTPGGGRSTGYEPVPLGPPTPSSRPTPRSPPR